jgi:hypothetical protein
VIFLSKCETKPVGISGSLPADEALTCLAELAASSGELHRTVRQFSEWAADNRPSGLPYAQAMPLEKRIAMTEEISAAIRSLARAGNRFRKIEAQGLYAEGLTMSQLATVFGVSRQRVSALLHERHSPRGPVPGPQELNDA